MKARRMGELVFYWLLIHCAVLSMSISDSEGNWVRVGGRHGDYTTLHLALESNATKIWLTKGTFHWGGDDTKYVVGKDHLEIMGLSREETIITIGGNVRLKGMDHVYFHHLTLHPILGVDDGENDDDDELVVSYQDCHSVILSHIFIPQSTMILKFDSIHTLKIEESIFYSNHLEVTSSHEVSIKNNRLVNGGIILTDIYKKIHCRFNTIVDSIKNNMPAFRIQQRTESSSSSKSLSISFKENKIVRCYSGILIFFNQNNDDNDDASSCSSNRKEIPYDIVLEQNHIMDCKQVGIQIRSSTSTSSRNQIQIMSNVITIFHGMAIDCLMKSSSTVDVDSTLEIRQNTISSESSYAIHIPFGNFVSVTDNIITIPPQYKSTSEYEEKLIVLPSSSSAEKTTNNGQKTYSNNVFI